LSNWIDVWRGRQVNNGANYTDLQDINYYSDGRFLNVTFLVMAPFLAKVSKLVQ
jgi:hypothetical protein